MYSFQVLPLPDGCCSFARPRTLLVTTGRQPLVLDTAHAGATGWEEAAGTAVTASTVQRTASTERERADDTAVARPTVQKTAARASEWKKVEDTAVARPSEWKTVEDTAVAGPANGVAVAEVGHNAKDETGLSMALVGRKY